MNIFVINAHQHYGSAPGDLNRALVNCVEEIGASNSHNVIVTEIESGYDIQQEIQHHEWADLIITQTPVYWFGAPWIYKKYIDEVFSAAYGTRLAIDDGRTRDDPSKQYGTGGLSDGKRFMISSTWNAPQAAFNDSEQIVFEGRSIDDALIQISGNYRFCGFEILPGFACFDVRKHPNTTEDLIAWRARIEELLA